jgi:methylated-DNA-protein-cysteine methyltransferase-like protein
VAEDRPATGPGRGHNADMDAAADPARGAGAGARTVSGGGPSDWVERVLDAVEAIPAGSVSSYGDIGSVAGCGPRQVGSALSRYGSGVAWWRVLRANGTLAPGLAAEQARRLTEEGVVVVRAGVDLSRYRFVR